MSLSIKLRVNLQSIEIVEACPIVSGTVEEYNVEFEFSPYWDGYAKTAVIDVICGDAIPDQLILDDRCVFSLGNAKKIRFGVYGVKDNRRLPTVYTREILVKEGVRSSEDGQAINPTQYEQLIGVIGDLKDLDTEDKSNLVNAINEAAKTGSSEPGASCENGATFIPNVSEDGTLSWSNDKNLPNPDPVNIQGKSGVYVGSGPIPPGYNVQIDPDGDADELLGGYYIPKVSQLDETTMKVEYTASSEDLPGVQPQIITLPRGEKGDKGDPGESADVIPDYVHTAASTVANAINTHQSENSFALAFLSDAHCNYFADTENAAIKQASQALSVISDRSCLDVAVHGGDISSGAWDTTRDGAYQDVEDYWDIMSDASKEVCKVVVPGNHDDAPYRATNSRASQRDVFALFGRRVRCVNVSNVNGCNYGYVDFAERKMRVIYLDTDDKRTRGTVETTQSSEAPSYLNAHNVGAKQLQWLATEALDFAGKDDPSQWGVVVVSHVALNVSGTATDAVSGEVYEYSTNHAAMILGEYRKGKKGSVQHENSVISYDFSALSARAEIYCYVHGHNHAYVSEYIGNVLSIGCPNIMAGRDGVSSDGMKYEKTPGTAEGTAFCVITVDRNNNMIYADHYGAGYDRNWVFVPIGEYKYTNVLAEVGYISDMYISSSTGNPSTKSGYYTTNLFAVRGGDVIRFANIIATTGDNYCRFAFYDADQEFLQATATLASTAVLYQKFGDDGNLSEITLTSFAGVSDWSQVHWMRFCCAGMSNDSIITVNEEIV